MLRWLLALDAIVTGVIYGVGSRGSHAGPAFYYLQQTPGGMRAIGWAYLAVGVVLAVSVRWTRARIPAHLAAVFLYLLYGVGSAASYTHGGDPGAGPVHLMLIAGLHAAMAVETARRRAS